MQARNGGVILGLVLAVVLAGGLYAATPLAAAGHRVETKARRTVSCTTDEGALQIWAFATNPAIGSAGITISTGNPSLSTGLLGVSSEQTHYGLVGRCHTVAKQVVLTRRGLTPAGV